MDLSLDSVSTTLTILPVSEKAFSDTDEMQVVRLPWLMSLFIVLYSLIFIIGFIGNTLVVFVVIRNQTMQTITNIFITNLAVSDICMCLLAVPFTPMSFFINSWIFGKALCHLVPMTLCISVYVSTLTSTAIAIDRYFVIIYPLKSRMKICMCIIIIIAIWFISVSISLPLGIYHENEHMANTTTFLCTEKWPNPQARQFFTVTSLVLQYIIPCCIIIFCYSKVSLALKKRSRVCFFCLLTYVTFANFVITYTSKIQYFNCFIIYWINTFIRR